jgi:hypothetical protein
MGQNRPIGSSIIINYWVIIANYKKNNNACTRIWKTINASEVLLSVKLGWVQFLQPSEINEHA